MKRLFFLSFFTIPFLSCNNYTPKVKEVITESNQTLPEPRGVLNDFEEILQYPEQGSDYSYFEKFSILDSTLIEFQNRTGNEIAIITIADIKPYTTLKDYAIAIGNQWGIGKKKENNGLLMAISVARKEIWIATGNGTEKIITDSICQDIIQQQMLPEFKKGKVFKGIQNGLTTIINIWSEHSQP